MSALARIAGNVGLGIGSAALRAKLASMGIGGDMFGLVEEELNREGLTMGKLAKPPKLAMFGDLARAA